MQPIEPTGSRGSLASAYALLVLTMFLWGSGNVVARAVHADISVVALTFWRWAVSLALLWPFVRRDLVLAWPQVQRDAGSIALVSALMVAGTLLSVGAVHFTTATNATLINATQPAVTAVVAWFIARERLTGRQAIGVALALGGIAVMVFRADPRLLLGLKINVGDLLMLGAVLAWASYAVCLHRGLHGISGTLLLFLISVAAVLTLLPWVVAERIRGAAPEWKPGTLAAVAYLAAGSTVLAVYLWNACIRKVGANRAAAFVNLIPVVGIALAVGFLGEKLALYHVIGAVLVATGISLALHRRSATV